MLFRSKHIYEEKAKEEAEKKARMEQPLTDADVRRILRDEFLSVGGLKKEDQFTFRNRTL